MRAYFKPLNQIPRCATPETYVDSLYSYPSFYERNKPFCKKLTILRKTDLGKNKKFFNSIPEGLIETPCTRRYGNVWSQVRISHIGFLSHKVGRQNFQGQQIVFGGNVCWVPLLRHFAAPIILPRGLKHVACVPHISYLVTLFKFTGVWKCSISEWTSSFQTNVVTARYNLPVIHDTFCSK